MDKLTLLQLGHPSLRQVSAPVLDVQAPLLQDLIARLVAMVQAEQGVGLAAPQVGIPLRLFIVASRPNLRYPHAPMMEPMVVMNPRILEASEEMVTDWEGCLCVPGLRGQVPRHRRIVVEYWDRKGQVQQGQWDDFVARIFQHELDHLDGWVFLDRVRDSLALATEQEYLRQLKLPH